MQIKHSYAKKLNKRHIEEMYHWRACQRQFSGYSLIKAWNPSEDSLYGSVIGRQRKVDGPPEEVSHLRCFLGVLSYLALPVLTFLSLLAAMIATTLLSVLMEFHIFNHEKN